MAQAVCDYFNDSEKMGQLDSLLKELELVLEENNEKQYLENQKGDARKRISFFAAVL